MPRKQADADEIGQEFLREIARLVGRAISLSVISAMASDRIEDHAIEKMDEAWTLLADKVIAFGMME